MSLKVSRKGIVVIIIFLIAFISVIVGIFLYPSNFRDVGAAITVAIFVFSAVGALLFTPIKDDLENIVNK